MKKYIINRFSYFLNENLQQAQKNYISTNLLSDDDMEQVLKVTKGDVYTNLIASIQYFKNEYLFRRDKHSVKINLQKSTQHTKMYLNF